MLRKSESCPLCLVLELMELLRQNVHWERRDLHVHVAGAKIQVSDDGGPGQEAVRKDQILDRS